MHPEAVVGAGETRFGGRTVFTVFSFQKIISCDDEREIIL